MKLDQLRQKFIEFYQGKGYVSQPASSIIPENDPSVLFTTAGMQQFKSFYTQPELTNHQTVVTVQPVVRTSDITEVGDATHLTMFEMLGNFRFGQSNPRQMKETAIDEAWEFITNVLGVAKDRIYVTVFAGDELTPADTESRELWGRHGVKIIDAGREDNFWGPTGNEGPCGPTSEIYVDDIEVWNLVFNQYYCGSDGKFQSLEFTGLDTGSGLERLATTLQEKKSVWEIEPYSDWVKMLEAEVEQEARVIVDHLKAAIFICSAAVVPGNKGREYVLRRLLRTMYFYVKRTHHNMDKVTELVPIICSYYKNIGSNTVKDSNTVMGYNPYSPEEILTIINEEYQKYLGNLTKASSYLDKWLSWDESKRGKIKTHTDLAFMLYQSYGFPKENVLKQLMILGLEPDRGEFEKLFAEHQDVSRAGTVGQFKGGLADHNEQTIKHHTAHHLLLAALREVLGPTVNQRGSNVTSERLRLDFSFDRKLERAELEKVEQIVNEKITENLPVHREEMEKEQAINSGALAEFGQKYGRVVSVYSIGDFSKELCGGPHVEKTGQLGRFKILKEEASAGGVRRIRARVQ